MPITEGRGQHSASGGRLTRRWRVDGRSSWRREQLPTTCAARPRCARAPAVRRGHVDRIVTDRLGRCPSPLGSRPRRGGESLHGLDGVRSAAVGLRAPGTQGRDRRSGSGMSPAKPLGMRCCSRSPSSPRCRSPPGRRSSDKAEVLVHRLGTVALEALAGLLLGGALIAVANLVRTSGFASRSWGGRGSRRRRRARIAARGAHRRP